MKKINTSAITKIVFAVLTIVLAFIVGGLIALLSGTDLGEAYGAMWVGAFGSKTAILQTIRYTFPIILLAMSFSVCNLCGFFNIGQRGQMYLAATLAVWVQYLLPVRGVPQVIIILIVGSLLGAILVAVPAFLKFRFNVNEAMIFLMFDSIAVAITEYMLRYSAIMQPGSAALPKSIIVDGRISLPVYYVLIILIVILYAFIIKRTTLGYHIKMIGRNAKFAECCGVPSTKVLLYAAIMGGIFSGLAGVTEILVHYHAMYNNFASGDLAFMGIAAALLANDNPIGIVFAALVLGAMKSGAIRIATRTDVSSELVLVIIGLIMLFATIQLVRAKKAGAKNKTKRNESKEVA